MEGRNREGREMGRSMEDLPDQKPQRGRAGRRRVELRKEKVVKVTMPKSSPPDTQLAKRTAAELSSGTIVSGKRGRLETPSESSSGEDSRVFPSGSPNEVSFLNIVLQSTPKDRMANAALRQRPSPRVRKGNRATVLPPEPGEVKEELCSQEIN